MGLHAEGTKKHMNRRAKGSDALASNDLLSGRQAMSTSHAESHASSAEYHAMRQEWEKAIRELSQAIQELAKAIRSLEP
jgi:uncharacterized protein YukE